MKYLKKLDCRETYGTRNHLSLNINRQHFVNSLTFKF